MNDKIEIRRCYDLVRKFFNDDPQKTILWFNTPNPALASEIPLQMIMKGRVNKLLKFIKSSIAQNYRL